MATITRLSLIKFVELIIVFCIIGIHVNSQDVSTEDKFISTGAEVGFLIIFVGLLAGSIMGTPVNRRVELFFALIGCALFIASGAIVIDKWHPVSYKSKARDMGLTRGSLAIIEGAVLLVDAFLTFRGES